MKYSKLKQFKEKLYFTIDDVAEILGIKRSSARVLSSRYCREGLFVRIKNNFYVLSESFKNYSAARFMKLSNYLQVPSYISLTTALAKWEITSQIQVNTYDACCLKRSVSYYTDVASFNYFKLSEPYYRGFVKKDGIFIAEKEKALVDALYLYSFGKYSLDFDALEIEKLDKEKIMQLEKKYPDKTRKIIRKICRI